MTTLADISIKNNSSWTTYLNLIYPVGSVYFAYTSTSPASRFGGQWSVISGDRYIKANTNVTASGSNSASHSHSAGSYYAKIAPQYQGNRFTHYCLNSTSGWRGDYALALTDSWLETPSVNATNGVAIAGTSSSTSVTITPKYQNLYCWRRTA